MPPSPLEREEKVWFMPSCKQCYAPLSQKEDGMDFCAEHKTMPEWKKNGAKFFRNLNKN